MTIEDAVEDYLIYAYFELDHPRRCYVGKTLQSRAEQRDREHRAGKSGAEKFNAFVKNEIIYGDRDFDDVLTYEVLEHFTGTAKECAEREGEHIQRKNSIENGWNLKPEGTGNGLLFPSTPPGEHKNRPPIRRSRLHIQGDLDNELIQDVIEFGLEQSILEKDKEYNFQELKTLIAKSFVAHANKSLNLTVQEPAPDEIKSVLNDWTKLENSKNFSRPNKWWEEQLKKSGFERPLDWKTIPNIIRDAFEKAPTYSPIFAWLEGSLSMPTDALFKRLPKLDKKWACYNTSPDDVWQVIRFKFLAKFPNTLQEIAEKEEAARLEEERQERERLQRKREQRQKEKEEQERLQKEREELQKAATRFVCWLFAILALGLVFVAIIFGESSSSNSPKPIPEDIQARSPKPKPAETIQDRLYRWREIKRQRRIDQPITDAPNVSPAPSNFPTAEDMAFASRRVADGMTWEQALRLALKNRTKTRQ